MFERALATSLTLPPNLQDALIERLGDVCDESSVFGYGVSDVMDELLRNHSNREQ